MSSLFLSFVFLFFLIVFMQYRYLLTHSVLFLIIIIKQYNDLININDIPINCPSEVPSAYGFREPGSLSSFLLG